MCSRLCHRLRFIIFLPRFHSAELSWQKHMSVCLYIYIYIDVLLYMHSLIWPSGTCCRRENLLKMLGKMSALDRETYSRETGDSSLFPIHISAPTGLNGHLKCRSTRNSSRLLEQLPISIRVPQCVRQPTRMRIPLPGARSSSSSSAHTSSIPFPFPFSLLDFLQERIKFDFLICFSVC